MAQNQLKIRLGLDLTGFQAGLASARKGIADWQAGMSKHLTGMGVGAAGVAAGGFGLFSLADRVAESSRAIEKLQGATGASYREAARAAADLNAQLGMRSRSEAADWLRQVAKVSQQTGSELTDLAHRAGVLRREFGDQEDSLLGGQVALMRAYKITAAESADALTFLMRTGGDLKDELLQGLREYSGSFAQAGFSLNETVAILQGGLNESWNLDRVADAFKESHVRLMDESAKLEKFGMGEVAKQLGSGAIDIKQAVVAVGQRMEKLPTQERYQLAQAVFGAPFEDIGETALLAILKGMRNEVSTARQFDDFSAALNDRFSQKWNKAVSLMTNRSSEMLDAFKPVLLPLVEKLGEAAKAVQDFAANYPHLTRALAVGAVVVGAAALSWGLLKIALGAVGGAWTLLKGLGLLAKGHPLLVIAGLTVAVVLHWERIEQVFAKLPQHLREMKEAMPEWLFGDQQWQEFERQQALGRGRRVNPETGASERITPGGPSMLELFLDFLRSQKSQLQENLDSLGQRPPQSSLRMQGGPNIQIGTIHSRSRDIVVDLERLAAQVG